MDSNGWAFLGNKPSPCGNGTQDFQASALVWLQITFGNTVASQALNVVVFLRSFFFCGFKVSTLFFIFTDTLFHNKWRNYWYCIAFKFCVIECHLHCHPHLPPRRFILILFKEEVLSESGMVGDCFAQICHWMNLVMKQLQVRFDYFMDPLYSFVTV